MILPLIRPGNGAENYFVQHGDNSVGMVPLAEYQRYGPASQPSIHVQIFSELAVLKGIALLRIHFGKSHLSREQAETLVKSLIQIYALRSEWPQTFNETPSQFDYNSFLENFSKL